MTSTELLSANLLIIDDEPANVRLLEIILGQAGYCDTRSTTSPREALCLFEDREPDLILLDLQMPDMDGFAVMQQLRLRFPNSKVPILVLTADITLQTKHRALSEGAEDFVCKPFDDVEVLLRINNLLERRFYALRLEEKVRERTAELNLARIEVLERLALAAEYRDDDTARHTQRVANISVRIGEKLGMRADDLEDLYHAAPLHDLGKIGIDDRILLKPGKLTEEEFAVIRRHVTIGSEILSGGASRVMQLAEEIARNHHERWDGRGYQGISGEDIPLSARIVAVADVFDALTHVRPYKVAWTIEDALTEISRQSGAHFDPRVVDAFLTLDHSQLV